MVVNRGSEVSGVAGFFLALSWIFVLLRVYCRIAVVRSFGADDYLSVIAQFFFTFFCAFAITGVQYGTGRHAADIIPQTDIPIGLKWWWACEPVYVLSNMALKFSIGVFLLRIAVYKTQRIILWAVIVISGIVSTFFFFLFIFQCWPIAYFWGRYTGMEGSCIDPMIIVNSTYAYSAVSCWADWTYCIIPGFMVWNLEMNIRTKISVLTLLALSALASIATFVRFPYISGLANQDDFLYATTDVAIWSTCETGIGITASAAATLRPLFRTFLSSSRLFGGRTTDQTPTTPWPLSNVPSQAGYLRSGSEHNHENEYENTSGSKFSHTTYIVGGDQARASENTSDTTIQSRLGILVSKETSASSDWGLKNYGHRS